MEAPTVYVVDDDAAVRASLAFALELEGYRVEAHDRAETLAARAHPAMRGCLVIDLGLPGMDGLSLISALRARGVQLPAMLITTQPSRKDRGRALAAGALIVEKPLLGDGLMARVRAAMAG